MTATSRWRRCRAARRDRATSPRESLLAPTGCAVQSRATVRARSTSTRSGERSSASPSGWPCVGTSVSRDLDGNPLSPGVSACDYDARLARRVSVRCRGAEAAWCAAASRTPREQRAPCRSAGTPRRTSSASTPVGHCRPPNTQNPPHREKPRQGRRDHDAHQQPEHQTRPVATSSRSTESAHTAARSTGSEAHENSATLAVAASLAALPETRSRGASGILRRQGGAVECTTTASTRR